MIKSFFSATIIIDSIKKLISELVKAKQDSILEEYNKQFENIGQSDIYILKWKIRLIFNPIKIESFRE